MIQFAECISCKEPVARLTVTGAWLSVSKEKAETYHAFPEYLFPVIATQCQCHKEKDNTK